MLDKMLDVVSSNQFKRDLKTAISRKLDVNLLDEVVKKLAAGEKLDAKYRDHRLTGNFRDFRECHIESDWLLMYQVREKELILFLFRTGTHSDLFG